MSTGEPKAPELVDGGEEYRICFITRENKEAWMVDGFPEPVEAITTATRKLKTHEHLFLSAQVYVVRKIAVVAPNSVLTSESYDQEIARLEVKKQREKDRRAREHAIRRQKRAEKAAQKQLVTV